MRNVSEAVLPNSMRNCVTMPLQSVDDMSQSIVAHAPAVVGSATVRNWPATADKPCPPCTANRKLPSHPVPAVRLMRARTTLYLSASSVRLLALVNLGSDDVDANCTLPPTTVAVAPDTVHVSRELSKAHVLPASKSTRARLLFTVASRARRLCASALSARTKVSCTCVMNAVLAAMRASGAAAHPGIRFTGS